MQGVAGFFRPNRAAIRLALSLAILVAWSCGVVRAAEAGDPPGMMVSVVKAKNACFPDMLLVSGTVVARDEVLVRPDVEGLQIGQVLVEDGAQVSQGQALAQLVRPDWAPGGGAKATLTANAAGALVHRELPVGTPISARGEPLFRIIRDGELELLVELPQSSLPNVKPGQTAQIETLDSTNLDGAVRLILPEIDPLTQLGHARITLRGRPNVKLGSFATAAINLGQSCSTSVPLSSILYGPDGAIVQVVRDNRVETRRVKLGLFDGQNAEISEGLAEGETVVARAGAFLRAGDLVRPAP